jgi:hypothetical protein
MADTISLQETTESPARKARLNEEGNHARFDSCAT